MASHRLPLALLLLATAATTATAAPSATAADKPNIVFILADDLGYNDISWHNADILSPNLARLASEGVLLEQSYVQPLCTPSRSALLTGRYPFRTGTQRGVYLAREPVGLSLNFTLLPELLRSAGYSTHLVGKWHLGFCAPEFLPQNRGFDTLYGLWNAQQDHYTHEVQNALDLHQDLQTDREQGGVYSTDLFAGRAERVIAEHDASRPLFLYLPFTATHSPVQAPAEFEALYPAVQNDERRVFSGMVTALDEAVARVVTALKTSGLYDNSVIVFVSDNGGMLTEGGNSWPLRGFKGSIWEGGTRTPAFVHSPLLQKTGYVSTEMIHVTDWAPTFLRLAGVDSTDLGMDGVDQWDALSAGAPSARDEIVYNIDVNIDNTTVYTVTPSAGIRQGDMKLVWGFSGSAANHWYPVPDTNDASKLVDVEDPDNADKADYTNNVGAVGRYPSDATPIYLFNVTADPTEHVDLSAEMPEVVEKMMNRLKELMEEQVPAFLPGEVDEGYPVDGVWQTGWCEAY